MSNLVLKPWSLLTARYFNCVSWLIKILYYYRVNTYKLKKLSGLGLFPRLLNLLLFKKVPLSRKTWGNKCLPNMWKLHLIITTLPNPNHIVFSRFEIWFDFSDLPHGATYNNFVSYHSFFLCVFTLFLMKWRCTLKIMILVLWNVVFLNIVIFVLWNEDVYLKLVILVSWNKDVYLIIGYFEEIVMCDNPNVFSN